MRARRPAYPPIRLISYIRAVANGLNALPIMFDDIYAMWNGMALSRTFDLMTAKPETPTNGEWARYIERSSHGLIVRRGVSTGSLDGLTPNDVAVIDHVWHTHGNKSKDELIHEVHHELTEWTIHWDDAERKRGGRPRTLRPDVPTAPRPWQGGRRRRGRRSGLSPNRGRASGKRRPWLTKDSGAALPSTRARCSGDNQEAKPRGHGGEAAPLGRTNRPGVRRRARGGSLGAAVVLQTVAGRQPDLQVQRWQVQQVHRCHPAAFRRR